MIDFLDGYFLLLEASTVRVFFSALEDGTSWDALDFIARSQTSDNLIALRVVRDKLWLLGSHCVEAWADVGGADTPFLPYASTRTYEGAIAPWGVTRFGTNLFWLARADTGSAHIVAGGESGQQKISTDAIDFAINSYDHLEDTEAFSFEQEGHPFIVFNFPTACGCGITWVYDLSTQLWHQRSSWDMTLNTLFRWRVRGVCAVNERVIAGDYATGDIYEVDLGTWTENGNPIKRIRRAPYLSAENGYLFLDEFEIGIQPGVGASTGANVDPQLMLRVSRDGGQTWTPYQTARMGRIGEYQNRAVWRRLGRTRADRLVIEVSETDGVPVIIGPGAWLRIAQGVSVT